MKKLAKYTECFDFACKWCGCQSVGESAPDVCPACGSQGFDMKREDRRPLHKFLDGRFIRVPGHDCLLADMPVVQVVWRIVMGRLETPFLGDMLPVASVSWDDCMDFLHRLNSLEEVREKGMVFRLPSYAEWKSAAACGQDGLKNFAWYWENSDSVPHPVGKKDPNSLGFYDMFGNVWEWCADGDRAGRLCAGGCWCCDENGCMAAESWPADTRCSFIGVRLCAENRP